MDAVSLGYSALAIVSILAFTGLIVLLGQRWAETDWARSVLVAGVGAAVVVGAASIHLLALPLLLVGPLAALGALFATVATSTLRSPSVATGGILRVLLLAAVATAAVFVPASWAVFATVFDPFGTRLGVIDLGGALPALVGGGAVACGVALAERRATRRTVPPRDGGWLLLVPAGLAWAAGVGWMAGLELAADDMVPIIVASALVMPPVAAITGSVIERLRFRRTTASGVIGGLLAGLAAAVSACAFVTVPLGVVIALAAGAVSGLLPAWMSARPALALAAAAAVGLVLIGAVGTNLGYIYTGQPELVLGQLFGTLVVGAGGLGVGAVLGRLLRR